MLIELPVVITPSLIIDSIILFFVTLVGLFNNPDSFKKPNNASFDTLSNKIASCYSGILFCFINEIAKYEDGIIIYALDSYNMTKYFIEYLKKQIYIYIYICFNGDDSFVNLRFKHNDCEYLFVHRVSGNNKIDNALKRTFKLKDKSSDLYLLVTMIMNQFNKVFKKCEKNEFIHIILPESDKDLKLKNKDYPSTHIFTDNKYYDNTYGGKMIYNRLGKKLTVIYLNF